MTRSDLWLVARVIGFVLLAIAVIPLMAVSFNARAEMGLRAIDLQEELRRLEWRLRMRRKP